MSAEAPDDGPIVLIDGACNLCHGVVQFVVPRDPEGTFRFASLQSDIGAELLGEHDHPTDDLESIVLLEDGECYVKSAAVVRIAALLGGVYALFRPFGYLPRPIRDLAYDVVATNRYRLFGETDRCTIPDGDVGARFLERTGGE